MQTINEILIVRNDKIGDFILILPALSWLKKNIPNCRITCIVSEKVLDLSKQNCNEALRIEKGCEIWNLDFQNAAFKMMPNKIAKELNS